MSLRFSRDSAEDLQDISEYTRRTWGEKQEERYLKQIYARLEEIQRDPSDSKARNDLFEECRVASVGRHLIFFLQEEDLIIVSRILHQSMDFRRHNFPDW